MGLKYQKPVARNLGDLIPDAQGNCKSGNIANVCSDFEVATCHSGSVASGGNCNSGYQAQASCQTGTNPLTACTAT